MSDKALIIIDMLRDFIDEDGALYCGPEAREIIPFVARAIDRMRSEGAAVIFLTDWHAPDDREFATFRPHAVRGSRGAEIIAEIEVKPGDHVVRKTGYSGFYKTDLDPLLARLNPRQVTVLGVCTSICVMQTVGDLRDRGLAVHVPGAGVADFDQESHAFALKHMALLGARVD